MCRDDAGRQRWPTRNSHPVAQHDNRHRRERFALRRGGGVDELECDGWAGGHVETIRFAPVVPLLIGGLPVPLWPDPRMPPSTSTRLSRCSLRMACGPQRSDLRRSAGRVSPEPDAATSRAADHNSRQSRARTGDIGDIAGSSARSTTAGCHATERRGPRFRAHASTTLKPVGRRPRRHAEGRVGVPVNLGAVSLMGRPGRRESQIRERARPEARLKRCAPRSAQRGKRAGLRRGKPAAGRVRFMVTQ